MIDVLNNLSFSICKEISGLFFDIDDTFTLNGKVIAEAYKSLWDLKCEGISLVPITGRSAGWCDHIARMWPVDGIVGENGAFFFWYDNKACKLNRFFFDSDDIRQEKKKHLYSIKEEILTEIPGAGLSSDQNYREADLAIDFCEDVSLLNWTEIDKICKIFKKHNVTFKISSIHVNGWFGEYNKIQMTKILSKHLWGIELDNEKSKYIFCGDSPNDDTMFEYFPISVGVHNILKFKDKLKHFPTYVTKKEGGEGFAEVARHILNSRQ